MKIVVGITGASGAPYAKRLLLRLQAIEKDGRAAGRAGQDLSVAVVLSSTAPEVWALECGGHPEELGFPIFGGRDYGAPFASGSAGWNAMIVIPCSMGTVGRIAHGISESLLTRAADVMLKERRPLLLVPRESPMSTIHLENLVTLARAGATILPAAPSFYGKPATVDALVDTVVYRVLDHVGLPQGDAHRWGSGVER